MQFDSSFGYVIRWQLRHIAFLTIQVFAMLAIVVGQVACFEWLCTRVYHKGSVFDFLQPLQDFFQVFFILLLLDILLFFKLSNFVLKLKKFLSLDKQSFHLSWNYAVLVSPLRGIAHELGFWRSKLTKVQLMIQSEFVLIWSRFNGNFLLFLAFIAVWDLQLWRYVLD